MSADTKRPKIFLTHYTLVLSLNNQNFPKKIKVSAHIENFPTKLFADPNVLKHRPSG